MNPLWQACLDKVEEMQREGWVMSTRSSSYISESGPRDADSELWSRMCIFKAYAPGDKEMAVAYVFQITASHGRYYQDRGAIQVRVEGPYEDSHDAYWLEQREHDNDPKRCWIVTPNYVHYVVAKDRADHHDSAGYAGQLFTFVIKSDEMAERMKAAGLKVSDYNHDDEDWYKLETRNLWHQGYIPQKHRHLWTPNAMIAPAKPITVGV